MDHSINESNTCLIHGDIHDLSLILPSHRFALRMKPVITVHQEAVLWILLPAGQCHQQTEMLGPFMEVVLVAKTLTRGSARDDLLNTAPHTLVEGFCTQNLAM